MLYFENYEEIKDKLKAYEELQDYIKEIAEQYFYIKNGVEIDRILSVELCGDTVDVEGEMFSRCGCCSDEYQYFEFPKAYLWDPDWANKFRERLREENLEALKKKQMEDERRQLEAEEAEYKQYLNLKEKFDG